MQITQVKEGWNQKKRDQIPYRTYLTIVEFEEESNRYAAFVRFNKENGQLTSPIYVRRLPGKPGEIEPIVEMPASIINNVEDAARKFAGRHFAN